VRLIAALLVVVAVAACQPIDGGVVTRTTAASPTSQPTVLPGGPASPSAPAQSAAPAATPDVAAVKLVEFPVGRGQGPHDVAPAPDGGVWYTAQRTGELGYLDPKTGATRTVRLGSGSSPHGVIVGPDGNPWITDSGLNAIVRVDARTSEVTRYPLSGPNVNLNTATFDRNGTLWFTGQSGFYGYLKEGRVTVLSATGGPGPYGISTCPSGNVYIASLAASYIAMINLASTTLATVDPPTKGQGARRVWCDSRSNVWVSEWNAGQLAQFQTETGYTSWREWRLPGANPMAYAVYVDDQDIVWLTDFGANAIVRFDPRTEKFTSYAHAQSNAAVRQLLGRPGEVWGAMSGQDKLLLIRTR
jgi:virginiamycin B lyase